MKVKFLFVLFLIICPFVFAQGFDDISLVEITTNDITVDQIKELVSTGKTIVEKVRLSGFKSFTWPMWLCFVVFCINVLLVIARIVVRLTPTKADDRVMNTKINPIVEKIGSILSVFFGRLK